MTLPAPKPSTWWSSLPDGVRIGVPDDLRETSRWVLEEQGDWFEDELRFVRRWFPEGGTAIDVGANYGCYTLSLAKRGGLSGRVIAFEPGSSVAAFLRRSVEANGFDRIEIVQAAVSDRSGTGWLRHLHTSELGELAERGPEQGPGESVDLVSLDDHFADSPLDRLDYLKIDAEGSEITALRGARSLLAAHSPLVMVELIHSGKLNVGLCEALRQRDFDLYRLVPGLMVLAPFDDSAAADPFQMNVFACRADRAEKLRRSGHLATGQASTGPVDRGGIERWIAEHGECPRDPDWGAVPAPMLQSMAEYAAAMERSREVEDRLTRLMAAHAGLQAMTMTEPALQASAAVIAAAAGWRGEAAERLKSAVGATCSGRGWNHRIPSLLRGVRDVGTAPDPEAFRVAILEMFERTRAWSSLFGGVSDERGLRLLAVMGRLSPDILRRLDLETRVQRR
jgi:FkbM family methyltransferase